MLARVADALYWLGRYLERAENVTRLLLVTEDLATEVRGFDEKLAHAQWADLLAIFPGAQLDGSPGRGPDGVALGYLAGFATRSSNPHSIHYSMRKARENARAAREALTVEVFVNLNDAFRQLEHHRQREIGDVPAFRDVLSATHRDVLTVVGAIEHTLPRDPGWCFLKLGESLERVYRAAQVLAVKLGSLGSGPAGPTLPLYDTQWRGLLRAPSSLESYRRVWGARMEPASVVQFLVFDAHAPRSLRFGTTAVKGYLDLVSGPDALTGPGRIIGRLAARLRYEDHEGSIGEPVPYELAGFNQDVSGARQRLRDAFNKLFSIVPTRERGVREP
jgi:uncharacterized alpha-E superfamily protein